MHEYDDGIPFLTSQDIVMSRLKMEKTDFLLTRAQTQISESEDDGSSSSQNSEEVNNNFNDHKLDNSSASHFLTGCQVTGNEVPEVRPEIGAEPPETDGQDVDDGVAVYELNDNFRIEVREREEWLCVSRLPLDVTDEEFQELVGEFGSVKQKFLIHSERTGKTKGYGLVRFSLSSSAIQARHVLDGQVLRGHILECDWLKPASAFSGSKSSTSARIVISLHSKCLFVDNLPDDYRDMGEFRRIFSTVVNPPYCQIAMKHGVIQRWGLVEFQTALDAETTLDRLNGHLIHGQPIRVQYCVPGSHAINIYMNFINNPLDVMTGKKALLEEAPSSKVYDQLNSLAQKNPWFVQSLQSIMTTAALQERSVTSPSHQQQQLHSARPEMNSQHSVPPPMPPPAGGDPAQAALILLLAGRLNGRSSSPSSSTESMTDLLSGIVKKLEAGDNAADILRSLVPVNGPQASSSTADIIQTALNTTNLALDGSHMTNASTVTPSPVVPRDKDPKLTELLLRSYQAKMARQQQHQQQQQQAEKSNGMSRPTKSSSSIDKHHPHTQGQVMHSFRLPPPSTAPQVQPSINTNLTNSMSCSQMALQEPNMASNVAAASAAYALSQHQHQHQHQQAFNVAYQQHLANSGSPLFMQPNNLLSMGQPHLYSVAAGMNQTAMYPFQAQLMWPAPNFGYPTAGSTLAYSPGMTAAALTGQTGLAFQPAAADVATLAYLQQQQQSNGAYLTQVGLKRQHDPLDVGGVDPSKRLRLATLPY